MKKELTFDLVITLTTYLYNKFIRLSCSVSLLRKKDTRASEDVDFYVYHIQTSLYKLSHIKGL